MEKPMPMTEPDALKALDAEMAKGIADSPSLMAALYRWMRLSR